MNDNHRDKASPPLTEVIIPREKAVFWMDDRGRWHNRHGRFEHKRIIDHFNHAIRRDEAGYYVTQVRGDIREKVYFAYEDTPLFVLQVDRDDPIGLVLNTGATIKLDPALLFVHRDQLYLHRGDERIRFSDRALMAMAPLLEETPDGLIIRIGNQRHTISEQH